MKYFKQMSMFMLMLLCSMTSLAYDFEVDGIYYNIIDLDSKTVAVTHNGKNYGHKNEVSKGLCG